MIKPVALLLAFALCLPAQDVYAGGRVKTASGKISGRLKVCNAKKGGAVIGKARAALEKPLKCKTPGCRTDWMRFEDDKNGFYTIAYDCNYGEKYTENMYDYTDWVEVTYNAKNIAAKPVTAKGHTENCLR